MDDDAVEEVPWCRVCRRSSDVKWKKHVYTKKHQSAALRFLRAQAAELAAFCLAEETAAKWRCRFCEEADSVAKQERTNWSAGVQHFASAEHRGQVDAFCRWHRCDHERQTRPQLWLEPAKQAQILASHHKKQKLKSSKPPAAVPADDSNSSQRAWKAQEFLASATARLQEVQAQKEGHGASPTGTTLPVGPQVTQVAYKAKTVTSAGGVLQNPLGSHEGQRVWGGGIVKLKPSEWVAWEIDTLVKEEQARRTSSSQPLGDESGFTHRMTDVSFGTGLGKISRVEWGATVGNVHTGAVPPWMFATEDEYKQRNRHQDASTALAASNPTGEERRDIYSLLRKPAYGPDWLPNFGSVWEDGPRSKTRTAFQKAAKVRKEPIRSSIGRPTVKLPSKSSLASNPPQAAETATKKDMPTAPAKAPDAPVAAVPDSTTIALSSNASLDSKKQQLLAQKERLRAKIAARKLQQ